MSLIAIVTKTELNTTLRWVNKVVLCSGREIPCTNDFNTVTLESYEEYSRVGPGGYNRTASVRMVGASKIPGTTSPLDTF